MRLWHFGIVKSLPELQLRSQWRECVAIAKDLSETGFTHHLLINRLMRYNREEFNAYCYIVYSAMTERGIFPTEKSIMNMESILNASSTSARSAKLRRRTGSD